MSKFYGTIQGNKGRATRCGTMESGIHVSAQSWSGSVIVRACDDGNDDTEFFIEVNDGSSASGREIFRGSLETLKEVISEGVRAVNNKRLGL